MCKISESRKRFQISTNISNEYLLCYSRTGSPPFQRFERFDIVKRGKDRSFSFDVFFPISHIYAESPRKSDFPFDFRGSTWTTRVHRTSVSTRNVYVFGVCVCVYFATWNGGIWSKRRGSTNKYKAIKLVFWNEIVIGSSFEKYFSFRKIKHVGIFLSFLWPQDHNRYMSSSFSRKI